MLDDMFADIGIPVGRMSINSLEELCKLTVGVTGEQDGGNISIADLHLDDNEDEGKDTGLYFICFHLFITLIIHVQGSVASRS